MAFTWESVPQFGGGLQVTGDPAALPSDAWTWADGWRPVEGAAEVMSGYGQVFLGTDWFPANGYQVIGICYHAPADSGYLLALGKDGAAGRLFHSNPSGIPTEITITTPVDSEGDAHICTQAGFLNGFQVLNYSRAVINTVNKKGLLRYALPPGGGTIAEAINVTPLGGHYLTAFQAHLVLGRLATDPANCRTLRWSSSNDESSWTPDVSNDADQVVLDDVESGITGVAAPGANLCAIFSRTSTATLTPTGGIPAFTRSLLQLRGHTSEISHADSGFDMPYYGVSPYGLLYRGTDDFYFVGDVAGLNFGLFQYWTAAEVADVTGHPVLQPGLLPQFVWHERYGMIALGRPGFPQEFLWLEPKGRRWTRQTLPVVPQLDTARGWSRHGFIGNDIGQFPRHYLVSRNGTIFADSPIGVHLGAVVDTKDFAFGTPPTTAYVDRIKVDWECLTNATTDAIEVLVYARDDLSRDLGTSGFLQDFTAHMMSLGTLTGGASELPMRVKGKFFRFRFRQVSGRARVRGFHLRNEPASDVKAAP